jgi:hypothetical protein
MLFSVALCLVVRGKANYACTIIHPPVLVVGTKSVRSGGVFPACDEGVFKGGGQV